MENQSGVTEGSPSSESREGNQESQTAESLNTDKIPETVPYQRFKEVNDSYRAADALLKAHEENLKFMGALEKLSKENPEFVGDFGKVVEKYTKKESPKEYSQPDSQLVQKVNQIEARLEKEQEEKVIQEYLQLHESRAKEIPAELKDIFDTQVALRVKAYTKGEYKFCNPKLYDQAYNDEKKLFEPILKKLTPSEAPAKDIPSPVSGRAPLKSMEIPKNFTQRRDLVQKAMESGGFFKR